MNTPKPIPLPCLYRLATLALLSALTLTTSTASAAPTTPASAAKSAPAPHHPARPEVWIGPTARDNGRALRELFTHPEDWSQTRAAIDGLLYTDLNFNKQFTDDELRAWLPRLREWKLKLALEVGALKPWGKTGEKTFAIERPMWERLQRLGGRIHAVAMDEPLCCARKEIHESDDYAVRETASYIALVRRTFPEALVGDIEPYPFIPLEDQIQWIDALQRRLAELGVRGLDFYRLDVNWAEFTVFKRGGWQEVRKLELACHQRKLPFSLIYWASEYPPLERKGLADDATWYVGIMQQGYDYAMVDGAPDQLVIESWIGAPARCLPESGDFTFTRSVLDFSRRFARMPR